MYTIYPSLMIMIFFLYYMVSFPKFLSYILIALCKHIRFYLPIITNNLQRYFDEKSYEDCRSNIQENYFLYPV